ncbi:acyl-CoA dehydrogenase [Roseateles terrae]|uniref:Acyl-CoA dehydrogenase n=1 Tax=Roseateles terrae TaxID=431060 RepID=A0ABR6GXB4_9BURK|nr:acyl-CoA dehydrogenase [Roseateles terrae]MBB3196742.1 hypothetical protein [Roseateles terrae]
MQLLEVPVPVLNASVDADTLALRRLGDCLRQSQGLSPGARLRLLIDARLDELPKPGQGQTLERWRMLGRVAADDLALAKLFESHTDARAILAELDTPGAARGPRVAAAPVLTEVVVPADLSRTPLSNSPPAAGTTPAPPAYAVWAAEAPDARVEAARAADGRVVLQGRKVWCSGANDVQRALLTVWMTDGSGPWLADVDLRQRGVQRDDSSWAAVGMAATGTASVSFDEVPARLLGREGAYLHRPGFWQGGAGIAACWHGALEALAEALRLAASLRQGEAWHLQLAMGQVDALLSANAALLRETGHWIDQHPTADARAWTLRARTATDETAQQVLRAVTQALGPGPFCRHAHLARLMADLPVFLRQSHGDRDLAALGALAVQGPDTDLGDGAGLTDGVALQPWRL